MQVGEEKEIEIQDFFNMMMSEGGKYEIWTPDGWVEIGNLIIKRNKKCYIVRTSKGKNISGAFNHLVLSDSGWKSLQCIDVNRDSVITNDGMEDIVAKESIGYHDVFDLEVKNENHRYYSNDIVSHNTGKTSFSRALAQIIDVPVYTFDLASLSNLEFIEGWSQLRGRVPAIALFEDFDCVFHDRKNVSRIGHDEDCLTFECVLNVIDGIEDSSGIFTILTVNDITKVSSAVVQPFKDGVSRPGRIDKIVTFYSMKKEEREKMVRCILSDNPETWENVVSSGEGETAAQFQRRCADLAGKLFWEKRSVKS